MTNQSDPAIFDEALISSQTTERMGGMISILKAIVAVAALVGIVYLQYRKQKWISDRKDQKADVQTLFSGKK